SGLFRTVSFYMVLYNISVYGVSAYSPHRYHFVNVGKTWTEAQSYCRQTYTDLATISNMEEMKKLNATLKDKPSSSVWIDEVRRNTGKWLWSLADANFYRDGDTYRNWNNGALKDSNNVGEIENCVGMFKDSGTWFDVRYGVTYTCKFVGKCLFFYLAPT
uniref:C-type lectin domain-containing protein n=1 Tax=Pygocentrus nattereri TaxID=42514 RepID=A0A3B4DTP0_PYGNA